MNKIKILLISILIFQSSLSYLYTKGTTYKQLTPIIQNTEITTDLIFTLDDISIFQKNLKPVPASYKSLQIIINGIKLCPKGKITILLNGENYGDFNQVYNKSTYSNKTTPLKPLNELKFKFPTSGCGLPQITSTTKTIYIYTLFNGSSYFNYGTFALDFQTLALEPLNFQAQFENKNAYNYSCLTFNIDNYTKTAMTKQHDLKITASNYNTNLNMFKNIDEQCLFKIGSRKLIKPCSKINNELLIKNVFDQISDIDKEFSLCGVLTPPPNFSSNITFNFYFSADSTLLFSRLVILKPEPVKMNVGIYNHFKTDLEGALYLNFQFSVLSEIQTLIAGSIMQIKIPKSKYLITDLSKLVFETENQNYSMSFVQIKESTSLYQILNYKLDQDIPSNITLKSSLVLSHKYDFVPQTNAAFSLVFLGSNGIDILTQIFQSNEIDIQSQKVVTVSLSNPLIANTSDIIFDLIVPTEFTSSQFNLTLVIPGLLNDQYTQTALQLNTHFTLMNLNITGSVSYVKQQQSFIFNNLQPISGNICKIILKNILLNKKEGGIFSINSIFQNSTTKKQFDSKIQLDHFKMKVVDKSYKGASLSLSQVSFSIILNQPISSDHYLLLKMPSYYKFAVNCIISSTFGNYYPCENLYPTTNLSQLFIKNIFAGIQAGQKIDIVLNLQIDSPPKYKEKFELNLIPVITDVNELSQNESKIYSNTISLEFNLNCPAFCSACAFIDQSQFTCNSCLNGFLKQDNLCLQNKSEIAPKIKVIKYVGFSLLLDLFQFFCILDQKK